MKELREKIYKEQFWEYDYDNGCEKANEVLKSLEKLDTNPMLLKYVLKCLENINIKQDDFYYIIVTIEHYRRLSNLCNTNDIIIKKIFNNKEEAEDYAENNTIAYLFVNNLIKINNSTNIEEERYIFKNYTIKNIKDK
jgi:hypothetical protein